MLPLEVGRNCMPTYSHVIIQFPHISIEKKTVIAAELIIFLYRRNISRTYD